MSNRPVKLLLIVAAVAPLFAGCSSDEKPAAKAKSEAPKIEIVEGMKYYVGGPVLKYDKYGRMRLGGFNGEVSTPSTRGLLIGFKKNDDETFDFRSWLNGKIFARSEGRVDDQGLLWYSERVSYDGNGNIVMRQTFEYDDDAEIITTKLSHIDPENGEVIKTTTQELPYTPPDDEEDDDDEDDEMDGDGGE